MSVISSYFDNLSNYDSPKGNLGDYQHAARLYVDNNMRLSPKFKYLYHVVFNVNPYAQERSPLIQNIDKRELNVLAKSADLPRYNLQTETLNQYNRKKLVHTGVQYTPVNVEFHDDNAGLTTLFWESYFRYYYTDSNYTERNADNTPKISYDAFSKSTNGINSAYGPSEIQNYKYGLDRANKKQSFFSSIQLFQMHPQEGRSTFTSATLVNPYITNFDHDNLSQDNSELSINRMTIMYESVQYNRGLTQEGNAPSSFAETHYDKMPSPIANAAVGPLIASKAVGGILGALNSIPDFALGNYERRSSLQQNRYYQNQKELSYASNPRLNIQAGATATTLGNINFPNTNEASNTTDATPKTF